MIRKLLSCGLLVSIVAFNFGSSKSSYAMIALSEEKRFKTVASNNHWGRSDIRAYLNRGLGRVTDEGFVINKNARLDSMSSPNRNGYDRHFSEDEHKIIRKTTVQTNDAWNRKICSCYETTDKFFLPSGNENNGVLSWGNEDISDDNIYNNVLKYDSSHLIPQKYFSRVGGNYNTFSWLRSPFLIHSCNSLVSKSDSAIKYNPVHYIRSIAPVFKVSLSDQSEIIFSSTVSAKCLKNKNSFGRFLIYDNVVSDCDKCWKGCASTVADSVENKGCGMFLKKKRSNNNFRVKSVNHNEEENSLSISYTGGEIGKAIVVCTETESSIYCAAGIISTSEDDLLTISCISDIWSEFNKFKESMKIKVWMEDIPEKDDLISATIPELFSWKGENFEFVNKLDEAYFEKFSTYTANKKVFALKKDLQCSWGIMDDLYCKTYNGASDQKIYFGRSCNDVPLVFWIAGRENEEGSVDKDGEVMCLYQAFTIEDFAFNSDVGADYKGSPKVEFILENQQVGQEYPREGIKINLEYIKEKPDILWRYKKYGEGKWINGMPSVKGEYELQAILPETDRHEAVYSLPVTFTVDVTCKKVNLMRPGGHIQGIKHPVASSKKSEGWTGSKVCFGSYRDCPLLFRVLDLKTVECEEGLNISVVKLDCDSVLKKFPRSIDVKTWMNQGLFKSGFSNLEWELIEKNKSCEGGDKIFELDLSDALNAEYGYSNEYATNRLKRKFGATALRRWWLSSKKQDENKCIGLDGSVECCHSCFNCVGVSPAMNLNLSSVLFISSGNKPSSSKLEAIQSDGTSYVWKFTLIDSSKIIRLRNGRCVEREENIIKVPYIYEGDNINRISVMITDALSEEIFYYGGLKVNFPLENVGEGSFELPNELPEKAKFYIIAEQINEPGFTDYASKPFELYI